MHPDGRMVQNVWIQQENGLDQQRAVRGDDSEASYPLLDSKNSLIRKKVLIQEGRRVGMNIHISEWQTKNNGFCKTLAKPAKKTLAEVANAPKQKLLTTKTN